MILENTLALLFVVNLGRATAAVGSNLGSFSQANNLVQLDETTDLDDTRFSVQADQELIFPQWIDEWIAPAEIRKSFPFYLAGYDEEGSPIYVAKYGKWNFTEALASYSSGDGGREELKNLVMKYLQQGIYSAWRHGMALNNQGIVVVCDWSGFTVANYLDDTAVEFCLAQMQMLDGIHHVLKHVLITNTNFASESLLGVAKPLMGNLLAKCKVSGSRTEKWLVHTLRTVSDAAGERIGRRPGWEARTRNNYYPWLRFA